VSTSIFSARPGVIWLVRIHCGSRDQSRQLRARARITWHFAAGPQARWRNASDELYPRWYVRSEQQSQRACGPQPERARRRVGICFVAAPRRCTPTSPASRRLASAHPALAPKCQLILARALNISPHIGSRIVPGHGTKLQLIFPIDRILPFQTGTSRGGNRWWRRKPRRRI